MSDGLRIERQGRVATVAIDRPPLNILDLATLGELRSALDALASDEEVQVVVLTGAGERAFSAGVAVEDHTPDKIEAMLLTFHGALKALAELPAVTLAVIRGHCLGGGMELASACDLRLAAEDARFGQPEIELGCYPPFAAALYPSMLGTSRTLDLVLTGRILGAAEAAEAGFVDRLAPPARLDEARDELVAQLTAKSAAVQRLAKRAVQGGARRPLAVALAEAERLYVEELARTEDMTEGLEAFLAKRAPEWKHR